MSGRKGRGARSPSLAHEAAVAVAMLPLAVVTGPVSLLGADEDAAPQPARAHGPPCSTATLPAPAEPTAKGTEEPFPPAASALSPPAGKRPRSE